ncbi:lytic transglycosylase domain-containing protein [Shimia ponticola]|uniref:lytic transglycosylase domain-containing protein n=1 Tax=Shimia ponticola TaxID=2582893 RepID=UPI0011BE071D|nr:lytic transglycosylase domain-containing protein [Shimia ponticola]
MVTNTLKAALCALVLAVPLSAEADDGPAPFPDFTFKRVKPPAANAQRRITVQITPQVQQAPVAPQSGAATQVALAAPTAPLPFGWFWAELNAKGTADASRAVQATDLIAAKVGQVPEPRLQTLQSTARTYGRDLLAGTIGKNISPAFALAVIAVESAGDPNAESRAGAQGLMQLMPDTARAYDVSDSFDPAQNIQGGIALLSDLMQTYDQDPLLALAAYNAGPTAVATHGGVPPFAETRAYVPKVMAAWRIARGLCQTPPDLVTDGCVFAVAQDG